MQLLVSHSQRTIGFNSDKVLFILGVRGEYTSEEQENINKYKLGNTVIYNSQAAAEYRNRMQQQIDGSVKGLLKGLTSLALAKMNFSMTIASLQKGHKIEFQDLGDLLECEETIIAACTNIKTFLQAAESFDGREIVIDVDGHVSA